ncbi:hypothetical protein ES702_06610 [subsurface metagenome]
MSIGDIGAVIDSLEFDAVYGDTPSICHVSGDIYAIAYFGHLSDGWLCTVKISSVGVMPATIEDSWEFDVTHGEFPRILKVYDTIYAIVYTDTNVKGQVFTFSIANDGTITKSMTATGKWSPDGANPQHFVKIADNVFAVVYMDASAHGWVQTIGISNLGAINNLDIDHLEFDGVEGREGFLCNIVGGYYAIAYRGPGTDGWLCTLTISDAGVIRDSVIATFEFDTGTCVEPTIVRARDNYFAIAYSGPGADGWLKIVEISNAGLITDPAKDSFEFDVITGVKPWLYAMGDGYIAVSYTRAGNPLWVYTFLVDALGKLNSTILDTQVIDAGVCTFSEIINRDGNYFAIAYCGPDSDGWVASFTIEMPVSANTQHLMMIGIG